MTSTQSQQELDIKCMQILRALVHHEERKLPEDWDTMTSEAKIKKYYAHK